MASSITCKGRTPSPAAFSAMAVVLLVRCVAAFGLRPAPVRLPPLLGQGRAPPRGTLLDSWLWLISRAESSIARKDVAVQELCEEEIEKIANLPGKAAPERFRVWAAVGAFQRRL